MKQFLSRAPVIMLVATTISCGTDVPLRPESPFDGGTPRQAAPLSGRYEEASGLDTAAVLREGDGSNGSAENGESVRKAASREYRLEVGSTVLFLIEPRQYQRFTRFESSDAEIAEVSSTGMIKGRSSGTAQVTGRFGGTIVVADVIVTEADEERPAVNGFYISPRFGTALPFGGARQFTASESWSDGHTRAAAGVTYSATGGTVSSMGLFTAGNNAGLFRVIAACVCGLADTAVVQVGTVQAQLSALSISPKTATVQPGELQSFKPSVRWTTGDTTPPALTFTASGGTVSGVGLFRAPTKPGTYRVIVAHTGGTLKDTAVVTVPGTTGGDPGTPPPPPPPSGNGAPPFFQDNFDSGVLTSANGFRWRDNTNVIVSDENAYSGSHALRFRYSGRERDKDGMSEQRFDMGRYLSELWLDYMIYVPANFAHRADRPHNNKFFVLWRDKYSGVHTWSVAVEYERGGSDENSVSRFMARTPEHTLTRNTGRPGKYWPQFIGPNNPVKVGQWNRIRFHVKAATTRTSGDGVMEMWVNDQLFFSFYEGHYHNGDLTVADAVLKQGYLMGWANSGFTETTDFFIDDVKFYSSNPGW